MCRTGDEAFKCILVYSVASPIMALNDFVLLIKGYIISILKHKVGLNIKFKCMCVTVCSLVMSPSLSDLGITTYLKYSHSTWFLTSVLVRIYRAL